MNYVFGTEKEREILKTKGDTHTNLTGYQQVSVEYPDQTITDNFHIIRKLRSRDDEEGNCYDWYEIDRHYRTIDKYKQLEEKNTQTAELTAGVSNDRADKNYPVGEYIIKDNTLYVVTQPIASGESFRIGQNIEATNVMNELKKLKEDK